MRGERTAIRRNLPLQIVPFLLFCLKSSQVVDTCLMGKKDELYNFSHIMIDGKACLTSTACGWPES